MLAVVECILSSRGILKTVSPGWWPGFVRRHPNVVLQTPATLSFARARASDRESLNRYFDELESTLDVNGLVDKPCLLFNMDESGMPLDPKLLKTVAQKGVKIHQFTSGIKTQMTVVDCVSASGQCIPPMVIWKRKILRPELACGEVSGTVYGLSSKSWIDQELFHMWFARHFLLRAPCSRPLLLLLDGHSSHFCPDTIKYAAESQVILFILPPNTIHLTQPLDKGVFGPLMTCWRRVCHNHLVQNPGVAIAKHNFSSLFSEAWMQAMTPRNIVSGFCTTGVYPIRRNALALPNEEQTSLCQKTGIAYIPLYTPVKRSLPKHPSTPNFLEEEMEDFELCYEEGGKLFCKLILPASLFMRVSCFTDGELSPFPPSVEGSQHGRGRRRGRCGYITRQTSEANIFKISLVGCLSIC